MHPIATALHIAAGQTDRNPTLAAKEAGNYAKGKFAWHGLTIAIENPKGSERSGIDKGGKKWRVKMPAMYGYVLGSKGADKDHVDVYIGDAHDARTVFVIDQIDARTGKFDEHKCMLDFPDKDAALLTYARAFSDGKAKDRIGAVNEMTVEQFKRWVLSNDTKKPLGHNAKGYAAGGAVMTQEARHAKAIAAALDIARKASGGPAFAAGGMPGGHPYGARGKHMPGMPPVPHMSGMPPRPPGMPRMWSGGDPDSIAPELTRDITRDLPPREDRHSTYDLIMEKARALNSRAMDPSTLRGMGEALLPDHSSGATRQERAEALARRVMEQPTDEFMAEALPGMAAPYVAGPAGRLLGKALPYALPAVAGATLLSGTAGSADEGQPKKYDGPMRPPAEVKSLQKRLKDAGYEVAIDGVDKGATRDAEFDLNRKQAVETRKLQLEEAAARSREAEAKNAEAKIAAEKEAAERTATERAHGLEKLEEVEKDPSQKPSVTPNAGYLIGAGLGLGSGFGVGKLFQRNARAAMGEANALMAGAGKGKIADRAAKVNAFYNKGGADVEPFIAQPGKMPPFKPNARAPAAGTLYPEPSTKPEWMTQGALAASGATESVIASWMAHNAETERAQAAAELAKNPNATTISRYLDARNSANNWEAAANGGRGFAGGQLFGAKLGMLGRPNYRPDVSKAEGERFNLDEAITKKKASVKAYESKSAAEKEAKELQKAARAEARKAKSNGKGPTAATAIAGGLLAPSPSGEEGAPMLPDGSDALPFSDGGTADRHHSYFQPRDNQARFKGGPVYPKDSAKSPANGKGHEAGTNKDDFKQGGAVANALEIARRYAKGGVVVGPIKGSTPGRADKVPMDVKSGSYIWPADVVAGRGEGNTDAGQKFFDQLEKAAIARMGGRAVLTRATGGEARGKVPIKAAHGERCTPPEIVAAFGGGDVEQGHRVCEALHKKFRAEDIRTLASLPGPSK